MPTPYRTRGFEVVSPTYRQHPDAHIALPTRGTRHSAGYDICTPVDLCLEAGGTVRVATDIKAYMQPSEVLQVYVRSSIGLRGVIMANTVGIIDSDYYGNEGNDGNITLVLRNIGTETFSAQAGERIAQGLFTPYLLADSDSLDAGETRTGGHGHTGR